MKSNLKIAFVLFVLLLTVPVTFVRAQVPYIPHFTTKNGLPGNNCYFLMQDRKGFIWIGTDAGISRYDGRVFENFTVDDGLPDNQILQIKEDRKGRIWFLALNGQMSYYFNGQIYNATNDPLLKKLNFNNAVIVSLLEDSKGRLWLGTNKNLLGMWDGKTLNKFVSRNYYAQFLNAYVHEGPDGVIRVYSTQAIQIFDNGKFTVEETKDLPLSYKTFNPAPSGRILFLKQDGLYQKIGNLTLIKQKLYDPVLKNDPGYFYSDEKEIWISGRSGVY
ncbi:MAG: diguanylate cyclase, partial [Chitinophagaceae bacterium]